MVQQFNFGFNIGDYVLLHNDLQGKTTIPKGTLLKVENITMGGLYKRSSVECIFTIIKKINPHLKGIKMETRIKISVYNLSGMLYETIKSEELESYSRERKIESILQ
jgi:hypothetical protein